LLEASDALGAIALAADISTHPDCTDAMRDQVAAVIGAESRRLAGVLRSLAAGAAVVALLAVGMVVAPSAARPAHGRPCCRRPRSRLRATAWS
jgi:hypothetical protein